LHFGDQKEHQGCDDETQPRRQKGWEILQSDLYPQPGGTPDEAQKCHQKEVQQISILLNRKSLNLRGKLKDFDLRGQLETQENALRGFAGQECPTYFSA
jgi:hypothetical protein